jgi:hypothetical protein
MKNIDKIPVENDNQFIKMFIGWYFFNGKFLMKNEIYTMNFYRRE